MIVEEEHRPVEGQEEQEEAPLPERPKGSISSILSIIPPASALKAKQKRVTERRIRIKYDDTLEPEQARIHPSLAKELGITDKLEIVVAGRHRFVFRAIIDEEAEENKVHVNPELMEENGVADGSIATVRAYRGSEKLGVRLNV